MRAFRFWRFVLLFGTMVEARDVAHDAGLPGRLMNVPPTHHLKRYPKRKGGE